MLVGDANCITGKSQGFAYQKVITATNGASGSICDSNFSATLAMISQDVSKLIEKEFSISKNPLPGSVSISVNGISRSDYSLNGRVIKFQNPPKYDDTISVSYRLNEANGLIREFPLNPKPTKILSVTVDNKNLTANDYQYISQGDVIILNQVAPLGSIINLEYEGRKTQKSIYPLKNSLDPSKISVYLNDSPISNYRYDPSSGNLILDVSPEPGSVIKVTFLANPSS